MHIPPKAIGDFCELTLVTVLLTDAFFTLRFSDYADFADFNALNMCRSQYAHPDPVCCANSGQRHK